MIRTSLTSAGSFRSGSMALTTLYPDKAPAEIAVKALLRSKPLTVINFWASWCPPCIEEAPLLEELQLSQQAKTHGIQFVSIASADDRFAALQSQKYGMSSYLQYFDDNDSQVSKANNVNQLPQTFLVDNTGKVLLRLKGMMTRDRLKTWQKAISYRMPRQPSAP